jgi:hypothetical protein
MQPVHKQPRKDAMRMGSHEIEKHIRNIRRKNFRMKKWIQDYYEHYDMRK